MSGYYNRHNDDHRNRPPRRRMAILAIPGLVLEGIFSAIGWLFTSEDGRKSLVVGFRWSPLAFALLFAWQVYSILNMQAREAEEQAAGQLPAQPPTVESDQPILYEQGLQSLGGADDRVPLSALSGVYNLDDDTLEHRLAALGSVHTTSGRCTGSVLGRSDFVITAAHCLEGASAQEVHFFSVACNASYTVDRIYVSPRYSLRRIAFDYAFIDLAEPVCDTVEPFQAITLTDDAVRQLQQQQYPLLSLSVFSFDETARHEEFPQARRQSLLRWQRLSGFGVFCRFAERNDLTGTDQEAVLYRTEGCDTFPGNSGGPLLVSLDGGQNYRVIATLFGCGSVDCFPRIKGPFAADLERFYQRWA